MKWLIVRMGSSFRRAGPKIECAPSAGIPVRRQLLSPRAKEFAPGSGTPLGHCVAARLLLPHEVGPAHVHSPAARRTVCPAPDILIPGARYALTRAAPMPLTRR